MNRRKTSGRATPGANEGPAENAAAAGGTRVGDRSRNGGGERLRPARNSKAKRTREEGTEGGRKSRAGVTEQVGRSGVVRGREHDKRKAQRYLRKKKKKEKKKKNSGTDSALTD